MHATMSLLRWTKKLHSKKGKNGSLTCQSGWDSIIFFLIIVLVVLATYLHDILTNNEIGVSNPFP